MVWAAEAQISYWDCTKEGIQFVCKQIEGQ